MTQIRPYTPDDLAELVALSLRAWAPAFASLRAQLGDPIFLRLHPDWSTEQAEEVRTTCTTGDLDVFVAERDRPVGFVAVALDAYQPRMGAVHMIAVDPAHQRQGVAQELMAVAVAHLRDAGMDIVVVETGGDAGHEGARKLYEATGHTLLPIARYFQLLAPSPS